MKLLILTQAIDRNDPLLSVYHNWILEIARRFESVTVICLKRGDHGFPSHIKVVSLGKELGVSRFGYIANFYRYIISMRNQYDSVFVHMNQEYILLGGTFWKLWGKKIYMWRNHHAGSFLTDIAASFCTKIFCTSRFSYTAKYKQTVLMPVGVDTTAFKPDNVTPRNQHSILFLARMAPVKKPHVLISALARLNTKGVHFKASFYGDALPADQKYYDSLKELVYQNGLGDVVVFHPGVPNDKTVQVYNSHEIFVNLSSSGMYDKTIFEAMSCKTLIISTNKNLEGVIDGGFIVGEDDVSDIATKIETLLMLGDSEKKSKGVELRVFAEQHSLNSLGVKIFQEIQ